MKCSVCFFSAILLLLLFIVYKDSGLPPNRGSYRSAHVLLNLLNKLGKRDKNAMLAEQNILSLFRNKFNKFNNTGERMLDSIYNITLKLF